MSDRNEAAWEQDSAGAFCAFARLISSLSPEVCSVSFHDQAAETLWLSEDFLLPEDHRLVEDSLADREAVQGMSYGEFEDARYAVALPIYDAHGDTCGAVRLTVDPHVQHARALEPLEQRLSPLIKCLAAEYARRTSLKLTADAPPLHAVDDALADERFELFVQPIQALNPETGHARFEVLLRLRVEDGSWAEPKEFLREAAKERSMPAVDRWVVRTLLAWLANNRKLWAKVPVVFAINLSAQSVTDANFIRYVESCVSKSGVPPQALCFEVTERFASSGNISAAESMQRLEALGAEVALDDFGGNSPSYGYLRRVPAHYFKIDASLIVAAPVDRFARAMIASIVRMASDLGVHTVAESVELEVQLDAVRALGVDYAQGYLMGRPAALAHFDFGAARRH